MKLSQNEISLLNKVLSKYSNSSVTSSFLSLSAISNDSPIKSSDSSSSTGVSSLSNSSITSTPNPRNSKAKKTIITRKISNSNLARSSSPVKRSRCYQQSKSHCLVFWLEDKKYTVVPINFIQADIDDVEEERDYDVLFNSKYYKATVKAIGSNEHCKSEQEIRIDQLNKDKKSKTNDSNSKVTSGSSSIKITPLSQIENNLLKDKIVELESVVENYKERFEQISSELNDHKSKLNSLYTKDDLDKLVLLSKAVLQLYDSSYNQSSLVEGIKKSIISEKYPNVKIDTLCLKELKDKLASKTISTSAVFRILVGILIPDNEIWSGREVTGNTIYTSYNEQIASSIDFINTENYEFNVSNARRILSQLCCEARRKNKMTLRLEDSDIEVEEGPDDLNFNQTVVKELLEKFGNKLPEQYDNNDENDSTDE